MKKKNLQCDEQLCQEKVRLRKDIKLCNKSRAMKYMKNTRFNKFTMLDEDILSCHIEKTNNIKLNKTIYFLNCPNISHTIFIITN